MMLTKEQMEELLTARKETSTQDYKQFLPPKGHKNCEFLNLLRHIVAFANSGGGVIVFGVENGTYEPVGLKPPRTLDDTDITTALRNYVDGSLKTALVYYKWKRKEFAFLEIAGTSWPLIFQKSPQCATCGRDAPIKHFHIGSTFIRQGSSTVMAPQEWIQARIKDLSLDADRAVCNNLPNRHLIYDQWVERTKDFEKTMRLIGDTRRRIIWIQGSGGIGKTALAYRVSETVVTNKSVLPDVDYVVWVSAKDNALTQHGLEAREPTLASVVDIVSAIARTTNLLVPTPEELAQIRSAEDAIKYLGDSLSKMTGLLVIDNLETVEDNQVLRFLQRLPGTTRALATTRHSIDVVDLVTDEAVPLEPMTVEEASELVRTESLRCGNSWLESDDDGILKVVDLSGRIPLAIRLIVPQLESPEALAKYRKARPVARTQLLDFCYRRAFDKLTQDERKVLLSVSLFDEGATLPEIAYVAKVPVERPREHDRLIKTVTRLWHLSLVSVKGRSAAPRYQVHSLVREFAFGEMIKNAALKQELEARKRAVEITQTNKTEDIPQRARELMAAQDYDGALLIIEELLKSDRENRNAHLIRAEILVKHGKDSRGAEDSIRQVYGTAERGSADWISSVHLLIELYMSKDRPERAVEHAWSLWTSRPNADSALMISKVLFKLARSHKDRSKAVSNFREAAEKAKTAVCEAGRSGQRDLQIEGFALWAMAALEFSPATAYQAAEAGLRLRPQFKGELESLRDKAIEEMDGCPQQDLLGTTASWTRPSSSTARPSGSMRITSGFTPRPAPPTGTRTG
jgi:tetratricopeptide (TPR) repeat protein